MHQSPQKQLGGWRREKYAALEAFAGDAELERRPPRSSPPKARRFQRNEDGPRDERARQHPRG